MSAFLVFPSYNKEDSRSRNPIQTWTSDRWPRIRHIQTTHWLFFIQPFLQPPHLQHALGKSPALPLGTYSSRRFCRTGGHIGDHCKITPSQQHRWRLLMTALPRIQPLLFKFHASALIPARICSLCAPSSSLTGYLGHC